MRNVSEIVYELASAYRENAANNQAFFNSFSLDNPGYYPDEAWVGCKKSGEKLDRLELELLAALKARHESQPVCGKNGD